MWSETFIAGDGIDIHVYRSVPAQISSTPSALPILLILHSLLGSGGTLLPVATSLTEKFEVIIPDARGHGLTQPIPRGSFLMENLVRDAELVLQNVSSHGRSVFLLGHSMGAATAARVAKANSDLIQALILEEPPWLRPAGMPVDQSKRRSLPADILDNVYYLKSLNDSQFAKIDIEESNLPPMAESRLTAVRRFDVRDCEDSFFETDDAINEAVEGLLMPTLLQRGNLAVGAKLSPQMAHQVLNTYPQGVESYYPDGPHFLHIQPNTQRWISEVMAFLDQHSRYQSFRK